MASINIPSDDLINLYKLIKEASANIDEANIDVTNAYKLLNDKEVYRGGANNDFNLVNSSLTGNYSKLSTIYSTLFQYLIGVLADYAQTDEEIAAFIENEMEQLKGK